MRLTHRTGNPTDSTERARLRFLEYVRSLDAVTERADELELAESEALPWSGEALEQAYRARLT